MAPRMTKAALMRLSSSADNVESQVQTIKEMKKNKRMSLPIVGNGFGGLKSKVAKVAKEEEL
jgi:hypothetical protein